MSPFIFYLCLFPLGDKWTPLYLPCGTDNCLQNAQNAVRVSASVYSKVPKTKSCLFVDISVQTCVVKYCLGEKNIVINCVYIMDFFKWGHIDPMVLLTELFSRYRSRVNVQLSPEAPVSGCDV